ncbi:MAG: hypothetical protein HOW73_38060 [Polyangiaceae bacterium]|nr:hypothetical protein [Polyangiaceae bacterium]
MKLRDTAPVLAPLVLFAVVGACSATREPLPSEPLPTEPPPTFVTQSTSKERSIRLEIALPRPAPQGRDHDFSVAATNAECERCHADIASEWRGSLHRQSWKDPLFFRAYAIESQPFCRGCHAPESDPSKRPTEEAAAIGVGCVTCHVQEGQIVGTRALIGSSDGHPVVEDRRLATEQACASCHDFDFPEMAGTAMQGTLREHLQSPRASATCQSCHMQEVDDGSGGRRKRHDFAVLANPELIRRASSIRAEREGDHDVSLTFDANEIGHAFPTGDMFRRLEVRATATDRAGNVIEAKPVVLARRFSTHLAGGMFSRIPKADTRLFLEGETSRKVSLAFSERIVGRTIRYQVIHRRMDDEMATLFDLAPSDNDILVAQGEIPP